MKKTLAFALFLAVTASFAQTTWTPETMIKFKRVAGTDISPDGKLVAYTIAPPVMDGDNSEFRAQVWVASTDGKSNVQFTHSDRACTNPKFSPDGKMLAFTSSRGSDGKAQVWIMQLAGGEAKVVSKSKSGVQQYDWSPDSKRIAYTSIDANSDDEDKMRKEKRDWNVIDKWKYAHLYVVNVQPNEKGEHAMKRLTKGEFQVNNFDWSKDGKTIAFTYQRTPEADEWPTSDISTIPSDSGAVNKLVTGKGLDSGPVYSPDGQWIAFVSDGGDSHWAGIQDVYVTPAAGGNAKKLSDTGDRQAQLLDWSPDGKEILYSETDHTSNRVFALPVSGGKPRVITGGAGTFGGASFSADGKTIAFIHQTTENSPEVFSTLVAKWDPKKLSDANKDFPKIAMGKTEVITWKSKDGKQIEGLLTYPVNYKSGRKYPLILNIHGGPAGVFVQNYTAAGSVYPLQTFAQQGYAVLRPNPRGSSGYGKEFRYGNVNDWGFGDYDDDQTGVDKVIEMGVAHPDSLVICGWSYGGYMTSFTVTKTDRFKAASLGAPLTNLMTFNGTADIPGFLPSYFEGQYWERMEIYQKHSAMFNIKNVKTPSQVIHGERDIRVPPSQGFEYYSAMKRLGVPSEMITYPRTPHGPQEPKFIQDIGERVVGWFNKYLGKKTTATAASY
ncbi:MAG TPA: S9 family peptidase [Cyclobacteriaceae bacterium]|nr:S9 family peptidase [Cyclobacteriaceae bacterium]